MAADHTVPPDGRARIRADWWFSSAFLPSRIEQVAAVCYRILSGEVEFLLVRTRRGRWTFPKGGPEFGLTRSQAAAREAFEEAGVRGRIEETSFTRYWRGKPESGKSAGRTLVRAYLLEVERIEAPQEPGRHPSWFSCGDAKLRMSEGRDPQNAGELAGVLSCALRRIRRIHAAAHASRDFPQE